MRIAERPGDIDAAWMQAVLDDAGLLGGARVTDLAFEGVGHGMMSDSFRFRIGYDRDDPTLPPTMIGKFAAADPTSRASATDYRIYRLEVGFYRDAAHTLRANVPKAIFADIDERTDSFTIIMHDLSPARVIDQIAGCSIADAEAALRELARLHASRWGDPTLIQYPWLAAQEIQNERLAAALPEIVDAFLERYRDMLEPEYKNDVRRLVPVYPQVLRDRTAPRTVMHGDYRLDNLLFDVGGEPNVYILDWGTVANATGLRDVSYFIGASLDAAQRREHEADLVRTYFDTLSSFPIGNYGWEDCWRDYRRFCFQGFFTGIAAPMMVERSDRADQLFLAMVRNYSRQINALGGFSFWE